MIDIINDSDVSTYSSLNKLYIPDEYLNSSFKYYFNNNTNRITIITNNDCYSQYNSNYCSCYMYDVDNNIVSESYSCNTNSSLPIISFDSLTNDINYSNNIKDIYFSNTIIYLLMFVVALLFTSRLTRERSHL